MNSYVETQRIEKNRAVLVESEAHSPRGSHSTAKVLQGTSQTTGLDYLWAQSGEEMAQVPQIVVSRVLLLLRPGGQGWEQQARAS